MQQPKLYLIDGNSFCYRAFFAVRHLTNSRGQPTNAIFGFVSMINKVIKESHPDMIAVAFDLKGPTFRHKKFDDYKVHRKPMPDDLVAQIPIIKRVVSGYNIPIFEQSGFEADDVIATIAKAAERKGIDTVIVTGDKDALQLVNDHITVSNTHKDGMIYDTNKVREVYGVGPDRITDIMALAGDATDNIPGVRGIGEKTAVELISEFGCLDGLYANIDKIKSESRRKMLKEQQEMARLSKELAILDMSVPMDIDFDALKLKEPDNEKLSSLFKELEFKSLIKDFTPRGKLDSVYKLIDNQKSLDGLIKDLSKSSIFAFDFETNSEDPMLAVPCGISFSFNSGSAFFVGLSESPEAKKMDLEGVLNLLKPIFENPKIKKVGQNIKYEFIILARYGIRLRGIYFDTMVASYILNPSKLNHNLEDISIEYLNHKMTTPIEELIGKGKSAVTMDKVDVDKVSAYCCEDSDVTLRVEGRLNKDMEEKGLAALFHDIEMPLIEVLAVMEMNGVNIDKKFLSELSSEMELKLAGLTRSIYEMAGEEFNINSPKQLSKILFEKLLLPIIRRTKTGISTDEEVLQKLASKHPLPKTLLEYRELSKLKSTYVDALPEMVNPITGRVHTSFNQTVTATGRLSSSGPNLQNIPIKTDEGKRIRRAFVSSRKNNVLISADYSQIELRILAHLSGDDKLVSAFKSGDDVHTLTAGLVFGVAERDVTSQMRSMAKTVNFGIIYGMSPYGLSQSLSIEVDKAKDFIDSYFQRYPGVRMYMEQLVQEARNNGFVTTLLGRRRYIPEINSSDMRMKQFAERTAINTPIQGTAADIIKAAMISIHRTLEKEMPQARMILQVHDELVFDVPEADVEEASSLIRNGMENVIKLNVPVVTDIEAGKNWLDMKPVDSKRRS